MSHPLGARIENIIPLIDDEFDYILSHFTPRIYKKHQFIIRKGALVRNDLYVVNGLLRAYP